MKNTPQPEPWDYSDPVIDVMIGLVTGLVVGWMLFWRS